MATATRDDDIYRRNPARDIEKFAVETIRSWLQGTGVIADTSAGGGPDFEIAYNDDRQAVGEVGWHEDPEIRAMWGETFKKDRHQTVDLQPGQGTWAVQLGKGARIKTLHRDLTRLVALLIDADTFWLEVAEHWPPDDVADLAQVLGIEAIWREDGVSDVAIYFMPPSGGQVPTDPDVIPEWIESVLGSEEYADTTGKLLRLSADERHVFLMTGTATPFGVDERLRRLGEGLPNRPLNVSQGITHVWVVTQFGLSGAAAALWTADGWASVPLPEVEPA